MSKPAAVTLPDDPPARGPMLDYAPPAPERRQRRFRRYVWLGSAVLLALLAAWVAHREPDDPGPLPLIAVLYGSGVCLCVILGFAWEALRAGKPKRTRKS